MTEFQEVLAKDVRPGDRIRVQSVRRARIGTVKEAGPVKTGLDSLTIRIVVDFDGEEEVVTRYPGIAVMVARG